MLVELAMIAVTVVPGNTLSGIAQSHGVSLTAVETANPQVQDPNMIYAGQVVSIPASPGSPSSIAPAYHHGDNDGDSDDNGGTTVRSQPQAPADAPSPQPQAPAATPSSASAFERCVIARESGGNARAVNASSGAGGLYQFLPSTWRSLGYPGLPQNAPPSVQRQAFLKLYAQAGTSPWSPSDGC